MLEIPHLNRLKINKSALLWLRKCAPSHLKTREITSFHVEMLEIPHFNRRETEETALLHQTNAISTVSDSEKGARCVLTSL